ncbi:MAG: N-acylneuraminate cytidylyltransferase [Bacteroidales bacterium]|nr:N-acylneuraminate cytidylyltransferase [Bacteroidales bacterium]
MVIAFIPVRGGSKSIPLKNIRPLCGKPLVCWCIEALELSKYVDRIVVATDSEEIAAVVQNRGYNRTQIYHRLPENARDTSSTESVMLEYIAQSTLSRNDVFMLVQATSPLTETTHFNAALEKYFREGFDSMLSCVRMYRFLWSAEGKSKNYDYRQRPRRQEFQGELMENGALYINSVGNIIDCENRLSGRIGVYEMPEYTATEIDEPDDWKVIEFLMRKYRCRKSCKTIKLFLSDVDGVLTDAGMYYSEYGDELKKFNTRDGMGFNLLHQNGIKTGIVTTEVTKLVERRAEKLRIDFLEQGKRDGGKLAAASAICEKLGIGLDEVAYIGDDINCYDLLSAVGWAACPADAVEIISAIPGIVHLKHRGGEGAVREFVDMILS